MSLDPYAWLKALHVAAAITFVAGCWARPCSCRRRGRAAPRRGARSIGGYKGVTTPAMLLAWAPGLAFALAGGWFRGGWLAATLALVVALSGAHGVQSARFRRLAGGAAATAFPRPVAPLVVGSVVVIAILVVVKPL